MKATPPASLSPSGGPGRTRAIVVGGSAGAVEALSVILPELPRDFDLPVLIVIHCPPGRNSAVSELFGAKCQMLVKEAEDKESIQGGTIYFAPPDYHLMVERNGRLSLSADDPVLYSRPSIDVLFESAADAYGPALAGLILSGANRDGARGLWAVCQAGGIGIVQSPETSPAPTMPQAAHAACPGAVSLGLEEILALLQSLPTEKTA